jgi:predicted GNAT superfamily acetyltransferase
MDAAAIAKVAQHDWADNVPSWIAISSLPVRGPDSPPGIFEVMMQHNAEQDAVGAAVRARVAVEVVDSVADLRRVTELFSRIWAVPEVPPFPHDIMRSLAHAGGRVHAAFREGQLLGAAVAVFGPPADVLCYSLIAGVSPRAESRGIGLALKLAQRAWALQAGAARMRWTFDPLLRRNARFNISRLGAVGTEYLEDFYGEIHDGVNDPETDRLTVTWDLRAPLPGLSPLAGVPGNAVPTGEPAAHTILAAGPEGEPATGTAPRVAGADPGLLRCRMPEDILTIRRANPALARRWRLAVREALGGAVRDGYQVIAVTDPGWYVLEKARVQP